MEKLIVSPGFVKKIEDEQDTQDQAITSNSEAITNLNNKISINSMTSSDLDTYTGTTDNVEYYKANDISQFTNIPSELSGKSYPFVLEVIKFQYYSKQIIHVFGAASEDKVTYVRQQTYNNAIVWDSWRILATKSYVDTRAQIFKTGSVSANSSAVVETGRGRIYVLVCGGAYATGSMYIIFGWTAGSGRVQTVKSNSAVTVSMDADRRVTIAATENISYSFVDIGSFT